MNNLPFDSDQLRQFARSRGWTQDNKALRDRLISLTKPDIPNRQIVFPIDQDTTDYSDALQIAAEKISSLERISYDQMIRLLVQSGDDTLCFRIHGERIDDSGIPLNFAAQAIKGAEQLLLSAACTTLRPQRHHPRMSRSEAVDLVNNAVLRHTQHGSFVLNVSVPIDAAENGQSALNLPDRTTFSRKVVHNVLLGAQKISEAIDSDAPEFLIAETIISDAPIVSSNLCDALLRFHESNLSNSLDISVDWSFMLGTPPYGGTVRFRKNSFARIEEIRDALRSVDQEQTGLFIGTVERLNGELGETGTREGEVLLAIFTQDSEVVRARVRLNAAQYQIADRAHMGGHTYIQTFGRLLPGRQPRLLVDVNMFELFGDQTEISAG